MATREDIRYFQKGILHNHSCIIHESDVPVFVLLALDGESNSIIEGVSKALIGDPHFRADYDNSAFMDRSLSEKLNLAYVSKTISKLFQKKEKSDYLDINPEQVYLSRFKGLLEGKYVELDISEPEEIDSFVKTKVIPALNNIPFGYIAGGDTSRFYLTRGDAVTIIRSPLFSGGCFTEDGKISIDFNAFVSNLDRKIASNDVVMQEWLKNAELQKASTELINKSGLYG